MNSNRDYQNIKVKILQAEPIASVDVSMEQNNSSLVGRKVEPYNVAPLAFKSFAKLSSCQTETRAINFRHDHQGSGVSRQINNVITSHNDEKRDK